MAFSAIFKSISVGNWPFLYISGGLEGLFASLTPSAATPRPGTPPANSRHTKQFLTLPHYL